MCITKTNSRDNFLLRKNPLVNMKLKLEICMLDRDFGFTHVFSEISLQILSPDLIVFHVKVTIYGPHQLMYQLRGPYHDGLELVCTLQIQQGYLGWDGHG